MEDERILKQKYNDLLKSYTTGAEYLVEHPEEKEKVEKRLEELSIEISNIMKMFPNMTEKEKNEGFIIDEVEVIDTVDTVDTSKQVETKPVKIEQKQTALQSFSDDWKIANQLAKSSLFPSEFQGHPENIIVVLGMAKKMDMDVFTIAQNLHLIKGRLSWSGSFCKTLIEKTGQYKDLDLVYFGEEGKDNYGCYLEATRIRDNKRIKGNKVTVKLAKDEKWWSKKDKYGNETSKWSTMTSQMLGYRAMAFFARLYCPEALNGVLTSDEVEDVTPNRKQPQDIL